MTLREKIKDKIQQSLSGHPVDVRAEQLIIAVDKQLAEKTAMLEKLKNYKDIERYLERPLSQESPCYVANDVVYNALLNTRSIEDVENSIRILNQIKESLK